MNKKIICLIEDLSSGGAERQHSVLRKERGYEGFPNVVCEAMCCGLPILCSNVCDNPRIVEYGENGFLFEPSDSQEMAKEIMRFANLSDKEKEMMRTTNREKAISLFSSETFLKKYMEII